MKGFIAGLGLGAVLTGVVLRGGAAPGAEGPGAVPHAPAPATASSALAAMPPRDGPPPPPASAPASAPAIARGPDCPPAAAPSPLPAASAARPVGGRSPALPGWVFAPLPPLSREHQQILAPDENNPRPPSAEELHRRLEQEPLDPNWSARMEVQIGQALTQWAPSPAYDVIGVSCRMTLCRLAWFEAPAASREGANALHSLMQQPWWQHEFGSVTSSSSLVNGRTATLVLVQRARPR